MTIGFGHMCPNAEEQFSLRYIIILSEYYKVVAKGLSDEGLDIYIKSSKVYLLLLRRLCLMIDRGWCITSKRGYKQTCNNWTGEHTCKSPVYIGKGFGTRVNERESVWSWECN